MCGVTTNIVTAIEIRKRNANEAPLFGKLLKATAENFNIREVSADKAYSAEHIIEAVVEAGGTPLIPFKCNATDAKGGLWEKMLAYYTHNLCCLIQSHCELGIEPVFWPGDRQGEVRLCTP
jgi:hypothetical protein